MPKSRCYSRIHLISKYGRRTVCGLCDDPRFITEHREQVTCLLCLNKPENMRDPRKEIFVRPVQIDSSSKDEVTAATQSGLIRLLTDGTIETNSIDLAIGLQRKLTEQAGNSKDEVQKLQGVIDRMTQDEVRLQNNLRDFRQRLTETQQERDRYKRQLRQETNNSGVTLASLTLSLGSSPYADDIEDARVAAGFTLREAASHLKLPTSIYIGLETKELTVSDAEWERLIKSLRGLVPRAIEPSNEQPTS